MLNQIILMGRLARDPELRRTQSGLPVASFTLAVERDRSNKGQEKQTDFIDIVAWRNTAEFVSKYFTKGQLVAVSGRLQIREWTGDNDSKHKVAEVVADNVYFAEGKRDSMSQVAPAPPSPAPASSGSSGYYIPDNSPVAPSSFAELEDDDGDLPF